jgi:DMSO/TMAO reductase YedYZ heme-binding membrane subunit
VGILYTESMQPVPEVKKPVSLVPSDWVLWYQSLSLACYIYIICGLYVGGLEGLVNPKLVNIAIGHTAFIMVLLSMGMSSITYYWHVADHAMLFRKYFGIIGFVFTLFHFIISLLLIGKWSVLISFIANPRNTVAFFTGLAALLILAFMTIISHRLAIKLLGGSLWRNLLRLGYLAVLLSLVHILWRNWQFWLGWLMGKSESFVPPLGLLVTVAAVTICILRVAMIFGHKKKP